MVKIRLVGWYNPRMSLAISVYNERELAIMQFMEGPHDSIKTAIQTI